MHTLAIMRALVNVPLYCSSLKRTLSRRVRNESLPFTASIQHVRNVNFIVQCEQCGMWRLIYSPNKLKTEDKRLLERKLDNFAFSCGTTLEELDLPEHMQNLAVRQF